MTLVTNEFKRNHLRNLPKKRALKKYINLIECSYYDDPPCDSFDQLCLLLQDLLAQTY